MNGNFKGINVNMFLKNIFRVALLFSSDPDPNMRFRFTVVFQSLSHVQFCDPMGCSKPGFPVFYYLPEFAQTHVHWVGNWCHPTISSSAALFFICPQSFPTSGSFPMSLLFTLGGQSIGASVSVLPMNIHSWFPLGLTVLKSLLSTGCSRVFSSITVRKHQFFSAQPFLWTNSHICTRYWKNHSFD